MLLLSLPAGCGGSVIDLGRNPGGGGGTGGGVESSMSNGASSAGDPSASEVGGAPDADGTADGSPTTDDTTGDPPSCSKDGAFDLDGLPGWQGIDASEATVVPAPVGAPSSDGASIECSVDGGGPYNNVRCYRDVVDVIGGAVVLRLRFWYDPPSTFDNVGAPSLVQALEFAAERWEAGHLGRLAVQWGNVTGRGPTWSIWLPDAGGWQTVGEAEPLAAEHWHSLELRGRIEDGTVTYEELVVDGQSLVIEGESTFEIVIPSGPERSVVAFQADANSDSDAYSLVVDEVSVEWCVDDECPDPLSWYRDVDGDGHGDSTDVVTACGELPGRVTSSGDCDDDDPLMYPPAPGPGLDFDAPVGRPVAPGIHEPMDWAIFVDGQGSAANLGAGPGGDCGALQLDFSLAENPSQNWVVARTELDAPIDLSQDDFLLVPFVGESMVASRTLEVKLQDDSGCMTTHLLPAVSELPACRTALISMQSFSVLGGSSCGAEGATDLSSIAAIEIGVSEVGGEQLGVAVTGTLGLGPLRRATADELRAPATHFECSSTHGDVMGRIARRIIDEQQSHGLVATWYDEPPSYNLYSEAMALMVLSLEYQRSGVQEHREAASMLADRLVAEQQQPAGAWADAFEDDGLGGVVELAPASVASTARTILGLHFFIERTSPDDPLPYLQAIQDAVAWIETQELGNLGAVERISASLALRAVGEVVLADQIANELLADSWDPGAQWLNTWAPAWGIAIDVMCNWGAELLRTQGLDGDALATCGLAARVFAVRSFDDATSGMGDIAGPWQPTVEFSSQYVHTGGPGSAQVLDQMLTLEDESGGVFPGAPNDFEGGDGWNTSMRGLSPSAWVYLALHGPGLLRAP